MTDADLLARIRAHPDRDALVQALECERDVWRSVQDIADEQRVADALWADLLALLRPEVPHGQG